MLSGVPPPPVASPNVSKFRLDVRTFQVFINRMVELAITSAGVPAGATIAKKPFIATPGTLSLIGGRSGMVGKRRSDAIAIRPHLPCLHDRECGRDRTHHHLINPARDVLHQLTCGAVRYFDQREARPLVEQFRREAAAPAVLSKAIDSFPGFALA